MLVALDTNSLYVSRTGVGRYVRGLAAGLRQAAPQDVQWSELAWPVSNYGLGQPQRALKTFYREVVWPRWGAPRINVQEACES